MVFKTSLTNLSVCAALFCACAAPSSDDTAQTADAIKAGSPVNLVLRIPAAESAHRIEDFDLVLANSFRAHQGEKTLTRDDLEAQARAVGAAFPDLESRYQIIEANASEVVFFETVSGTHTGGAFAGIPVTGRRMGITFSGVYRVENGKIVEEWFEGDFVSLGLQLQGIVPAPTQDEMIERYQAGNRAAEQDCWGAYPESNAARSITAWKAAIGPALAGDSEPLAGLVSPHFHATPPGAPSVGFEDFRVQLAQAGQLGDHFVVDDVVPIYVGAHVAVAYGPVHYQYSNPNGLLGLPPVTPAKPVSLHELHTFRTCGGAITRQLTHVDALALRAQLTP